MYDLLHKKHHQPSPEQSLQWATEIAEGNVMILQGAWLSCIVLLTKLSVYRNELLTPKEDDAQDLKSSNGEKFSYLLTSSATKLSLYKLNSDGYGRLYIHSGVFDEHSSFHPFLLTVLLTDGGTIKVYS